MKYLLFCLKLILFLLIFIFLELNKNTLLGYLLTGLLIGLYLYISNKYIDNGLKGFGLILLVILLFVGIVFLTWPPTKAVKAVDYDNPDKTEIITTNYGDIRGVVTKDKEAEVFAGIPYAKAPVGDLRWKEPEEIDKWEGILEADEYGPMSMQETNIPIVDSLTRIIGYHDYKISLKDNFVPPVSEDSLYLNIYRPTGEYNNLPVLVYVHGGSLNSGQTWYEDYNGVSLSKQGIIVVNMAYRLGVFGFYADEQLVNESKNSTTGNYGLLDVICSLNWIKNNIEYFGGDPNNITLAGESAGSAIVSALCTSDLATGLFDRVVLESSTVVSKVPPHSYRSFIDALNSGKKIKEELNVSSVEELRKIDAKDLVKYSNSEHHITVDGYALNQDPYLSYLEGKHNETKILHGYNAKESGPFILFEKTTLNNYEDKLRNYFKEYTDDVLNLYNAKTDEEASDYWAQIYGAVFFNYPHYCLNRLANNSDIPVYEYYFNKDNGRLGSWHSGEEIYCYRNIPDDSKLFDEEDRQLSKIMSSYWLNFVKYGDPNGEGLVNWPINKDNKTLLEFNSVVKVIDEKYIKLYEILDKVYGYIE